MLAYGPIRHTKSSTCSGNPKIGRSSIRVVGNTRPGEPDFEVNAPSDLESPPEPRGDQTPAAFSP